MRIATQPFIAAADVIGVILVGVVCLWPGRALSFSVFSKIDPAYTQPVEVLIWVKDGVMSEDEARITTGILEGLSVWEAVPTADISFHARVEHGTTQPPRKVEELLIIVGNQADLTTGGASHPSNGWPGTWFGAAAQLAYPHIVVVAAHEVGHAIGFEHSTLGGEADDPNCGVGIMNWTGACFAGELNRDDIAAVSLAYPRANMPLSGATGTIRGRLVDFDTDRPISGVNVVAVRDSTNTPTIARVSGALSALAAVRSDIALAEAEGEFQLAGLPPGTYRVEYRDGHSFRGRLARVGAFPHGAEEPEFLGGFQADAFDPFTDPSGPFVVGFGQVVDLGDTPISVRPMSFDGMIVGEVPKEPVYDPVPSTALPAAVVGANYDVRLHVAGGVRDIAVQALGLPDGLRAAPSGDPRFAADAVNGNHFVHFSGTPTTAGSYSVDLRLTDARGFVFSRTFDLTVIDRSLPTATPTPIPSSTPNPTRTATPRQPCIGDCDASVSVTVDELVTMVNVALGSAAVAACSAGDADGDECITVDELVRAVNNALEGCPS